LGVCQFRTVHNTIDWPEPFLGITNGALETLEIAYIDFGVCQRASLELWNGLHVPGDGQDGMSRSRVRLGYSEPDS
jgi:hypothetical protein